MQLATGENKGSMVCYQWPYFNHSLFLFPPSPSFKYTPHCCNGLTVRSANLSSLISVKPTPLQVRSITSWPQLNVILSARICLSSRFPQTVTAWNCLTAYSNMAKCGLEWNVFLLSCYLALYLHLDIYLWD